MYRNISGMTEAQWNDAVTNAGRYVLTKAVFNGDTTLYGDGTDGAVVSIKFDEQMENSNGLSMGGTIASQCKVEIRQPSTPISLVNSTFVPYVGLKDSANREGYVPLGEFFATSADSNSNGGVVSVVGYDRFCKLEVPYEPTVSFPTTTTAIMADLATNRFTFSGTITDRPIDEFRVGTVKDWIGWLAGLEGKNARFNRDGQLEFVYYDITQYDYTVDRENQYMAGVNTKTADNVTINAITSGTEENPIVSGNGRSITFSNPYMTQEILDDIRNTEIVDSLTEVSGELITVDAIEAPAKSVEVNIEPYQNLNGYDHPWAGGAEKNKLPNPVKGTYSSNGLTLTVDDKGVITVSGTTTSSGTLLVPLSQSYVIPSSVMQGGTGCMYLFNSFTTGQNNAFVMYYDDTRVETWQFTVANRKSDNWVGQAGKTINKIGVQFTSGQTYSGTFAPMFSEDGTTDATSFIPYSNICPISGLTEANIIRTGKNLIDQTAFVQGSISGAGADFYSTNRLRSPALRGFPSTEYSMSVNSGVVIYEFHQYDKDNKWIKYTTVNDTSGTVTTEANCAYIKMLIRHTDNSTITVSELTELQLELGSAPTAYKPYQGQIYTISWSDAVGTVYGGTLDFGTGVLTVTHKCKNFDNYTGTITKSGSATIPTGRIVWYIPAFSDSPNSGGDANQNHVTMKCSIYDIQDKSYQYNVLPATSFAMGIGRSSGHAMVGVNLDASYSTTALVRSWLQSSHVDIWYPLETPETYQLNPVQVELLKGTNNIWADDSTLNITYLATPRANMSFRPMELQWRGNPCVQCGDRIFVETETNSLTALVMAHTLSIEGGMNDVIRCFGSSDAEIALDKSPMEKKISAAYNALQLAIQDATALLNGTRGGIFEITKENDINTGWLIKESASPNYMGNVIIANYNGIGFSTDGGATYGTAITTDGHINGQYITAHSVDVEALSVGNTSDPFSNYVYIGRRRPNDDNTDMVIRIGVASQSMVQEMRGNRTSIYKTEDVQAYVNGSLTDAELDARALMYYSDTDYVLLNLGSFRIGGMLMQAQANGGVKFIKAG